MSEAKNKTQQLQLIPVFALRELLQERIAADQEMVRKHYIKTLNQRPRNLPKAVNRLTREDLIRVILSLPEISAQEIQELFEEYRYGSNPSFNIYLFNPQRQEPLQPKSLQKAIEAHLNDFNQAQADEFPKIRSLYLNDFGPLPDRQTLIEGHYRFLKRLDYIDQDQNAASCYQTIYGFFWINTLKGYVTIHARDARVLHTIREAVQSALDLPLTTLIFTKQFKNRLPFLERSRMRAGRLHHPDPGPGHFRWLALQDENPYKKGYEQLEASYPEVRSLRYRETVAERKETTLTIQCDRGALRLAGKLRASQFRSWCLDRLEVILDILTTFEDDPAAYLEALNLSQAPELAGWRADRKRTAIAIMQVLLAAKLNRGKSFHPLDRSPLEMAQRMGSYFRLQVPLHCPQENCEYAGMLTCAHCDGHDLILKETEGAWLLECPRHRGSPWSLSIPLRAECQAGHQLTMDRDDLEAGIVLIPSQDLLEVFRQLITHHLPYTFEPPEEGFVIRGPNLIYFPELQAQANWAKEHKQKTYHITVHQDIERVEGGQVIGLSVGGESS